MDRSKINEIFPTYEVDEDTREYRNPIKFKELTDGDCFFSPGNGIYLCCVENFPSAEYNAINLNSGVEKFFKDDEIVYM